LPARTCVKEPIGFDRALFTLHLSIVLSVLVPRPIVLRFLISAREARSDPPTARPASPRNWVRLQPLDQSQLVVKPLGNKGLERARNWLRSRALISNPDSGKHFPAPSMQLPPSHRRSAERNPELSTELSQNKEGARRPIMNSAPCLPGRRRRPAFSGHRDRYNRVKCDSVPESGKRQIHSVSGHRR
jgi:hypothetical protein